MPDVDLLYVALCVLLPTVLGSSAFEKLMAEVDKALHGSAAAATATSAAAPAVAASGAIASIDTSNESDSKPMASSTQRAEIKEAFRAALGRYVSGEEIDGSPCYVALERAFAKPKVSEMDQSARDSLMLLLMNCVEGEAKHNDTASQWRTSMFLALQ